MIRTVERPRSARTQRPRRVVTGVVAVVAAAGLAACGSGTTSSGSPSSSILRASSGPTGSSQTASSSATLRGSITVLAAASLAGTFDALGRQFSAAHPGTRITVSYGSSATLAASIVNGAPADVFAAANQATMTTVTAAGLATRPTVFASNTLEIAVPKGNPGKITGLKDFSDPRLRIALCAPTVPCGSAATQVFAKAGIAPRPDTLEKDVKAALQKVEMDEVDAALVYRTDVQAAHGSVEGIDFPQSHSVVNRYPIAALSSSKDAPLASAFVAYVTGPDAAAELRKAGFGAP